jgi:hypothetical protein
MRRFVLVGTSLLRVAPHEFLFGTQPIFDVVAVLSAHVTRTLLSVPLYAARVVPAD